MRADSCISSTKILVKLARALGLKAEPQSVVGEVFNPAMARWLDEHSWDPPNTRAEQERLAKIGGRFLVVGYEDHPDAHKEDGRWNGHLVAVVEGQWMFDLTFDQFHRPQKSIPVLGPLVVPWTPEGTAQKRDDGVAMRFFPRGEESSQTREYETAPDWTRRYRIVVNGEEHGA
jgi:hypothetical protein